MREYAEAKARLFTDFECRHRIVSLDSEFGQELADRHAVRAVPATIINGRLTFVGVPSRQSAEKALSQRRG